ncbi:30S ribosomal protein S17 [Candidatus Peregrinibacteria bacterium HGW-Peregrinibacteria-1]|jgi:small subunit ribosomal protein S17|nr:ribosomal protein S17 [uncultured bacterium]PKL36310.1 MAG: 30S ribosomal protein S17 [Candidatus Peregrinibacteria bacterium HGW-Peregrinibacteria-1]
MRQKKGEVTSTKNDKTLVVTVHHYENHPKYKKRFRISKKYHVHNPENTKFMEGDEVTFYETRPISKLKKWTLERPANEKTN